MTTVNTRIREALVKALEGMAHTEVHGGRLRPFTPDEFSSNGFGKRSRHIVINTPESDFDDQNYTMDSRGARSLSMDNGMTMSVSDTMQGGCCEFNQSTNVEISIYQAIDISTELELDTVEAEVFKRISRAHLPDGVDLRPARRSIQRPQGADSLQVAVLSLTYETLFGVDLRTPDMAKKPVRLS